MSASTQDRIAPGTMPDTMVKASGRSRRRVGLLLAFLALTAAAALYGWHWYSVGRFFVTTDDAYIDADAVSIAPRVSGYVSAVSVADNQKVKAGAILARIDDRDYKAALAQSDAEVTEYRASLSATDSQIVEQKADIAQAQADLEGDEAKVRFSAMERQRAASLSTSGAGSLQIAQRTDSQLSQDTAGLRHALAALDAAKAKIGTLEAEREGDRRRRSCTY